MTLRTLVEYLAGRRRAIMKIAETPGVLWLGGLFVLSAGFAGEYDAEDLMYEPWHLAIPLVASVVTSLLLYALVRSLALVRWTGQEQFWSRYRAFLTLYWMTAPLAWLYAVPVERFLSAGAATEANLWLLALVSVWRVVLITRVVIVLFGATPVAAIMAVMLFADSVLLVILWFTPIPIFNVMGGVPLSRSEAIMRSTAFLVGFLGGLSWFIWLTGVLVVVTTGSAWRTPERLVRRGPVSWPLWAGAACSLLIWAAVLPFTQPEQQLRRRVEYALTHEQIPAALTLMSAHERGDFPPHWEPPPWLAYAHPRPNPIDVLEQMKHTRVAGWVRDIFLAKMTNRMRDPWRFSHEWQQQSPEQKERLLEFLQSLPETAENQELFKVLAQAEEEDSPLRRRLRVSAGLPEVPPQPAGDTKP